MRLLAWILVLMVGAAAGWRYRGDLAALVAVRDTTPAKPIEFDNGTVRVYAPAPAASAGAGQASLPPGTPRKCVRGDRTTYSDVPCPAGTRELPVATDRVSVVPGNKPAAAGAGALPAAGDARKTLQDALDLSGNVQLRDKMMERAIEKAAR